MRREPAPSQEADKAILAEQVRVLYVEGQRHPCAMTPLFSFAIEKALQKCRCSFSPT
jgi:hypothetical protein